jgi:hypothetical protein
MTEPMELTLDDGSSVWLDRSAILSFSALASGTRLVILGNDGSEEQVDVRDSFASVSDLMDPVEPPAALGDFIE